SIFCRKYFGCVLFSFQAEDGIRDRNVTGVQTCALPLSSAVATEMVETAGPSERSLGTDPDTGYELVAMDGRYGPYVTQVIPDLRSEERRVGKECQSEVLRYRQQRTAHCHRQTAGLNLNR